MNHIIANPKTRKYIYGVVVAVIPLLVIAGVIAEDQVQVWLNLAAAVLGFGAAGLAAPNTPSKDDKLAPADTEQGI